MGSVPSVAGLSEALAAKRLPLHTPTQDAVDLPKMVQVVCRFQADELLDRLPSAYLLDPLALHPPCAWDRLQQSQVALAQRPKDRCRKARILLRVTPSAPPIRPDPTTSRPRPDSPACFTIATPAPAPRPPSALRSRRLTTFRCRTPDQLLGHDIAQTPIELRWGGLLGTDGLLIAKIA